MSFDFNNFGSTSNSAIKPSKGGFDISSFGATEPQAPTPPSRSFGQKAAGFLGVEKLGQGIGQAIANKSGVQDKLIAAHDQNVAIAEQLSSLIKTNKAKGKDTGRLQKALDNHLKFNSEFINTITDVGTGGLTNKEVIGSALNTAALFAPGAGRGAKTLTKMAVGAGTGYAFDVGNNLQQNKEGGSIFKPGLGTAIGASLPLITSIFGKGAKIEQINERLTPTEKKNLGTKGKEVAQYLVDKRVMGTPEQRLAKVNDLYTKMEEKVQGVVNSSGVSYPKQPVIDALQSVKSKFLNDPAEYKGVSNKVDEVVSFLQEHARESIPAGVLNDYKRSLANSAYNEKGNKVLSEGLKSASDTLYSFLKDTIPGLQPLNSEYGKIITARGLLNSASTRSQIGMFEKGAAFLAGSGLGSSVGDFAGAGVGGFLAPKVANAVATPVRSTFGVGVNEINKLIEKLPDRIFRIPVDKSRVVGGALQLDKKAIIRLLTGEK